MKAFSLKRAFLVSAVVFSVGMAAVKFRNKKPSQAPKQAAKDDKILFV